MTTGFERYSKKTRRALFLEEMEQVKEWFPSPAPTTAKAKVPRKNGGDKR